MTEEGSTYEKIEKADQELWEAYDNARDQFFFSRFTSGDSIKVERSLFQVGKGGAVPTSPLQLELRDIPHALAKQVYSKWHYLGEKGLMSSYNFGVYTEGNLWGAISFGIPNAPALKGYYEKDTQEGWFELKRLALSDSLPKNSESRVIAIAIKLLKKKTNLKGVITYADTQQGHTGIIYKASNFEYKGLTAQKTDLFIDDKPVGKLKGVKYSELNGEWRKRSRKHLFILIVDKSP